VDVRIGLVGALDAAANAADAFGGLVEFFGERQRFFLFELSETLTIDRRHAFVVRTTLTWERLLGPTVPRSAVAGL
jgi:hypothetical protein